MSLLNKYMHPRNIYKIPPDFKELAILYPDFRNFVKQDITGKVSIDFKDQASLRVLTNTLLKKDFNLDVDIPSDRLVPTLPLRLNYLLWIEDLLACTNAEQSGHVNGVDIGTGSTGIYSLLAAKLHRWRMLATEVDTKNVASSTYNIERNTLQDLVTVQQVAPGKMLIGVLSEEMVYDFCMCNPPFFSNEQELEAEMKSRSKTRPGPHNAQTGAINEMVVPGGEVAFIRQMIEESKFLRNRIRIYTTMVGVKSSLVPLKALLTSAGIKHCIQTEFCQGHTTRWGLAWTFEDNLNLENSLPEPVSRKQIKKRPPLKYIVPFDCDLLAYTVTSVSAKVKEILLELKMECKEVKNDKHETLYCATALENTWANQRRKRRCGAAEEHVQPKDATLKPHIETDELEIHSTVKSLKRELNPSDCHSEVSTKKQKTIANKDITNIDSGNGDQRSKKPILVCHVLIRKISSEINVQVSWLDGSLGRDAVHQVLQYLKNKLSKTKINNNQDNAENSQ